MNALADLLNTNWAQRVGWALVHFLWQGAAIAALLWLALRLLSRRGPQVRYAVACLALLLMAAAPVLTFLVVQPAAQDLGRPAQTSRAIYPEDDSWGKGTLSVPAEFREGTATLEQAKAWCRALVVGSSLGKGHVIEVKQRELVPGGEQAVVVFDPSCGGSGGRGPQLIFARTPRGLRFLSDLSGSWRAAPPDALGRPRLVGYWRLGGEGKASLIVLTSGGFVPVAHVDASGGDGAADEQKRTWRTLFEEPVSQKTLAATFGEDASSRTSLPDMGKEPDLAAATAGPVADDAAQSGDGQPWTSRVSAWAEPAMPYAVAVWLAGVLACSMWHVGGWLKVQRLRRVGQPLADGPNERQWQVGAGRLADALGIHRTVRLLKLAGAAASDLAGPVVVGVLRPAVMIPAAIVTGLAPNQVEAILAHELAHIRRHDYLVNLLQTLAETLLFYHPAMWWASARIRAERENCCDDLAASAVGDGRTYAAALAALAEVAVAHHPARRGRPLGRLAPARRMTLGAKANLLSRIRRLLGLNAGPTTRWTSALVGILLAALLAAGVAVPLALLRASDAESPYGPPPTRAAIQAAAEALGLTPPVRVTEVSFYEDGGTTLMRLVGDQGKSVDVYMDQRLSRMDPPPPRHIFTGDYPGREGSIEHPIGGETERAVLVLLRAWMDRQADSRKQARLLGGGGVRELSDEDVKLYRVVRVISALAARAKPATQPTTRPARRDVSIVNSVELADKDDLPAGMYCGIPAYPHASPGPKWVYEYTIEAVRRAGGEKAAGPEVLVLPQLSARLAGTYAARGTLEAAEQVVQGHTITIRLRYIDEDKDIGRHMEAGNPVHVSGKEKFKSLYLWGHMPKDLPPGRYTVKLELDEYDRKGDQLVPAPFDSRTRAVRHERLNCQFTVEPPAVATQPVQAQWSRPVNGLRARIDAGRYLTKQLGMEVGVQFENTSSQPVSVDFGELQALAWKVLDADGKEVEPAKVRRAEPAPSWYSVAPGQQVGRILGTSQQNRDERLTIGFYEWQLKPGRYSSRCTLVLQSNAAGLSEGQTAWKGKLDVPAAEFEVIGEVSDDDLRKAAGVVKAVHFPTLLAQWEYLAKLVQPGMTVRQMYLVLPPKRMTLEEMGKAGTIWNGNFFIHRYWLDDSYAVEASGIGTSPLLDDGAATQPAVPGEDTMILTSRPRITRLAPAATRPATQPVMSNLAKRITSGMPEGWELTGHGRSTPMRWSDDPALKATDAPAAETQPASAPATQPTSLWLEQVRKSLPKGWSVKPAATLPGVGNPVPGEAWVVTRDDPMRVTYSSPVGMMPQEQTFQIIIVAGPKVSADDYRRMVEFNKALERKFRGNEATLNRMGRLPWWGQRTGENTNNPYLLPTHFEGEHSLSIACRQLTSSYHEFASKEDEAQASEILAAITAKFRPHVEASAPQTATTPATPSTSSGQAQPANAPIAILRKGIDSHLPDSWEFRESRTGKVEPTHWEAYEGVELVWQRKGYTPEDWKRGKGGEAHLWIMAAGYAPERNKYADLAPGEGPQIGAAAGIGLWHGRRVFFWGSGGDDWPTIASDVAAAMRASEPLAQPGDPFLALVRQAIAMEPASIGRYGGQRPTGLDFGPILAKTGQDKDLSGFPRDGRRHEEEVKALADAGKAWAVAALLDHGNVDVKIDAARALVRLARPETVPALLAAAKANDYPVGGSESATVHSIYRRLLKEGLEKITGLKLTPKGLRLTEYPRPGEARVFTSEESPERFPEAVDFAQVEAWLADKYLTGTITAPTSPAERATRPARRASELVPDYKRAAQLAEQFGAGRLHDLHGKLIGADESDVPGLVALVEIGDDNMAPAHNLRQWQHAAMVLGQVGDRRAVPFLLDRFWRTDRAQWRLVTALGRLGADEIVPDLVTWLHDGEDRYWQAYSAAYGSDADYMLAALEAVTGEDFGTVCWEDQDNRKGILAAIDAWWAGATKRRYVAAAQAAPKPAGPTLLLAEAFSSLPAEEMDGAVGAPVGRALVNLPGVDRVDVISQDRSASIYVLAPQTRPRDLLAQVRKALDQVKPQLPVSTDCRHVEVLGLRAKVPRVEAKQVRTVELVMDRQRAAAAGVTAADIESVLASHRWAHGTLQEHLNALREARIPVSGSPALQDVGEIKVVAKPSHILRTFPQTATQPPATRPAPAGAGAATAD